MKLLRLFLSLPLFAVLSGCGEPQADVTDPKTYRAGGITFDYPKNWKIDEDSVSPEIHFVMLGSPGNAVVILQSYPTEDADDLPTYSKAFSDIVEKEVPIGKIKEPQLVELPAAHGYQWIEEAFEITLLGLSVPHRRLYGAKEMVSRRMFLILQAPIEDFEKAETGFALIRDSLRSIPEVERDEK